MLFRSEGADVFKNELWANQVNFILMEDIHEPFRCEAKIRYSSKTAPCTIEKHGDLIHVVFDEKQRAITPGQAVVFYKDQYLVGGGTIIRK